MRAYGDACRQPDDCDWIPPAMQAMGDQTPTTRRDTASYSAAVNDLFQKMGMKK